MNCDTCGIECTDENKCDCTPDAAHCKNHHPVDAPGGDAAPAGEDAGKDMA